MATIGPTVAQRFHAVIFEPWLMTAFTLMAALATPFIASLADRFDNRRLYAMVLVIFAVGSCWTAVSPSMSILLIGRLVQGFGAGGLFTLGLILIGRLYQGPQRSVMLGRQSAMWGLAALLGPSLGGISAQNGWWWRILFGLNVPLTVLALWWLYDGLLPTTVTITKRQPPIDYWGTVLLGGALVNFLAIPTLWATQVPRTWLFIACGLGIVFSIGFVQVEKTSPMPIIPMKLLTIVLLRRIVGITVMASALIYSLVALVPLWAQEVWQTPPYLTGFVVLPVPLGWAIGSLFTGRLVARWGSYWVSLRQMLTFSGGIALLIFSGFIPLPLVWGSIAGFMTGLGMGGLMMTLLLIVQASAPSEAMGTYTGLYNFTRNVGNALGPGVFGGMAIAIASQNHQINSISRYQWLHAIDITAGLILGLSLFMGWFIKVKFTAVDVATMPRTLSE